MSARENPTGYGRNPTRCPFCGAVLASPGGMRVHRSRKHRGESFEEKPPKTEEVLMREDHGE